MKLQSKRRLSALVVILGYAVAVLACGAAEQSMGDAGFLVLEGPWPASVEGELEIVEIADAGGEDYIAFGWIETEEGTVNVHGLGKVLEAGDATDGGRVRARVRPVPEVEGSYEIIEIRLVP